MKIKIDTNAHLTTSSEVTIGETTFPRYRTFIGFFFTLFGFAVALKCKDKTYYIKKSVLKDWIARQPGSTKQTPLTALPELLTQVKIKTQPTPDEPKPVTEPLSPPTQVKIHTQLTPEEPTPIEEHSSLLAETKFRSKIFTVNEQFELMKTLKNKILEDEKEEQERKMDNEPGGGFYYSTLKLQKNIYNMLFNGIDEDVGMEMEELYSVQYIDPMDAKDKSFLNKFSSAYPDQTFLSLEHSNKMHNGSFRPKKLPQAMREIIFYLIAKRNRVVTSI